MAVEFLDRRHEIWHEPGGDRELAKFYTPKGWQEKHPEQLKDGIAAQIARWVEHMEAEGRYPAPKSQIIVDGPWTEPVRSTANGLEIAIDLDCYYLIGWFVRTKPLLVTLDEAEEHQAAAVVRKSPGLRPMLQHMDSMEPAALEEKAKDIIASVAAGEKEAAFQKAQTKKRGKR